MLNNPKKQEFIGLRCTKEMKEQLEQIATEQHRSLSQTIEIIVEEYIRQKNGH